MSRTAATKPEEQEEQEEDFYDCQETLGCPDQRINEVDKEEQSRQDIGASSDMKTDRLEDRGDFKESEEEQGERLQEEQNLQDKGISSDIQTDLLMDRRDGKGGGQEEEEAYGHQKEKEEEEQEQGTRLQEPEEEQGTRLQELDEEEQGARMKEQEEDSDSELKESSKCEVEFDDDYLRKVEEDLTEEEKESRRQQSLSLKERGNTHFKSGEWLEAERSYKEALHLCPVCFSRERAVLFSNRAAARLHQDLKDPALADCSRAIELNPAYTRALLRRAELYEQMEKLDESLEDYKRVVELEPSNSSARQACARLPGQIQERNEKLKEEMLGKLKDLGNLVLRPFGLSTSNFQVNQDAQTGSYSINFIQSPNNNNNT